MTLTFRAGQGLSFHELMRIAAVKAGTYNFPDSAGGAVTVSSGLTVNIASITAASVTINGAVAATNYVGSTLTAGVSSSTLDRIDTIYYDGTATLAIAAGSPVLLSATVFPVPPTLAAGQIAVANLYVGKGYTSFAASDIDDRRDSLGVPNPFDGIRTQFIAGRRKLVLWSATQGYTDSGGALTSGSVNSGVGVMMITAGASDFVSTVSGEPYIPFGASALSSATIGLMSGGSGSSRVAVSPAKSPRMLARMHPPAGSANVTVYVCGFFDAPNSATANGAGLRAVTTGNLKFVTRQGGSETATDLGVSPTALTSYIIETTDAGVTWKCYSISAGVATLVATHTTNVPTAATALAIAMAATEVTASVAWKGAHLEVEATF